MPTVNEVLQDKLIGHQVGLLRLSSGITNQVIGILNKAEDDIVNQLKNLEDQRLNVVLKSIRGIIAAAKNDNYALMEKELTALSIYENKYVDNLIKGVLPVKFDMVTPSREMLSSIVTSRPFQGKLLKEWVEDLSEDVRRKVRDAIRTGMVEGESIDKMARRIRGTRANNYKDGLMEIERRHAQAMVRTAVNHTATRAREMIYTENEELFSKVQWLATLDNRTCVVKGQKVLMSDGSKKSIEDIKIGDKVLSKALQSRVVCGTHKSVRDDVIKVVLNNGKSILCTKDHMFLTDNGEWVEASQLKNKRLMSPGHGKVQL